MTSSSAPVLLALGANLGSREHTLAAAIEALGRTVGVSAVSPVYETAPMYLVDQDPFLNLVVSGHTGLDAPALLAAVKRIEAELGRVPTVPNGPRLIDIDIILMADLTLTTPALTIPHPRMRERAFVMQPAADIAGDWVDPVTGLTVSALFARLPKTDHGVRRIDIDLRPVTQAEDQPIRPVQGGLA